MSATAADPRRQLLARVHIAKKEMALADDSYRAILMRITGKSSSADCTVPHLKSVLDEFRRLGWKPRSARRISANPQVRIIYAIWKDIAPLLEGSAGDGSLRGFVQRMSHSEMNPEGVSAPEFLNPEQAVIVIEGLKNWRARLQRKGGKK